MAQKMSVAVRIMSVCSTVSTRTKLLVFTLFIIINVVLFFNTSIFAQFNQIRIIVPAPQATPTASQSPPIILETPVDPKASPVDPKASPVDPKASPVDPKASPSTTPPGQVLKANVSSPLLVASKTTATNQSRVDDAHYLYRPDVCGGHNLTLIICVPISRANAAERKVIRETWGACGVRKGQGHQGKQSQALVFFVGTGTSGEAKQIQSQIDSEAAEFSDIVQGKFVDSYQNLTLKSIALIRWAVEFCSHAHFLLKADDDMYINMPLLLQVLGDLEKSKSRPFVVGSIQVGARPLRDQQSKWYASYSQFSESTYPKYASGTAYAMSLSAARTIRDMVPLTPFFYLEDIYITGLCVRRAEGKVELVDDRRFTYNKPAVTGSSFDDGVSGHRYTLGEIRKIHTERGSKCS